MNLLRDDLPVRAAFSVAEVACRAKLDQNEMPYDLPGELKEAILERVSRLEWNRYPQPKTYRDTKEAFADATGERAENLFLTAGCDQVILTAFWLAGGAGRRSVHFEPAYPMVRHYARITGTRSLEVALGAEFNLDALPEGKFNLTVLASPNNPTGGLAPEKVVQEALKRGGLVLVDEAYNDFSGHTVRPLLEEYGNLLIGRSLSKSLLAGMRLGYGVAAPEIASLAETLHFAPYHLNVMQLAVLAEYSRVRPLLGEMVEKTLAQRARIETGMDALGVERLPSRANFVMFRPEDSERVFGAMKAGAVRIRDLSGLPGCGGWLRVTVGRPEENELFLEVLRAAC